MAQTSARPKSSDKVGSKYKGSPVNLRKKPSGLLAKASPRQKYGEPPAARRQKKHRKEMLGNERIDNRFADD